AGEQRGPRVTADDRRVDLRGELVLAGFEGDAVDDDTAVGLFPPAFAGGADDALDVLAEPRAGGAGVDRQLGDDAVVSGGAVVQATQVDLLDVDLVGDQPGERRDSVRLGQHHGQRPQRLADAHLRRLAQAVRDRDGVARGV